VWTTITELLGNNLLSLDNISHSTWRCASHKQEPNRNAKCR